MAIESSYSWGIFGFWFIICLLVFVVLSITAAQARRHAMMLDRKTCPFCHTVYGADARFCGRCGRTL